MLLSRDVILAHLKRGTIVIEPFDENHLNTASYDVVLGEWYWKEAHPQNQAPIHNPYDEESTKRVWLGPYQAEKARIIEDRLRLNFKNINPDDRIILLESGETILGHTEEFIGGREIVVAKMYARSSMGRNFVEVCKDAGWGDVGYFNRWTMEITNNSRHYSIPLVIGRRVAQMVFYEVAPPSQSDYVSEGGKYQTSLELDDLKKNWRPEMMIPKMHLDREIRK